MTKGVLLDTSFFLRFLNENDPLFKNANNYYKYFLSNDFSLVISTISIAEYCVGGSIDELPLRNIKVLPFNIDHSIRTGEFAKILFDERKREPLSTIDRKKIPDDSKLFAQADVEKNIEYFLTSDTSCKSSFEIVNKNTKLLFSIIDINTTHTDYFGQLDFNE